MNEAAFVRQAEGDGLVELAINRVYLVGVGEWGRVEPYDV